MPHVIRSLPVQPASSGRQRGVADGPQARLAGHVVVEVVQDDQVGLGRLGGQAGRGDLAADHGDDPLGRQPAHPRRDLGRRGSIYRLRPGRTRPARSRPGGSGRRTSAVVRPTGWTARCAGGRGRRFGRGARRAWAGAAWASGAAASSDAGRAGCRASCGRRTRVNATFSCRIGTNLATITPLFVLGRRGKPPFLSYITQWATQRVLLVIAGYFGVAVNCGRIGIFPK